MRRILAVLLSLLLITPVFAQQGNTVIIRFAGVPSGTCSPISVSVNNATGDFYDCNAGTWLLVGPGSSGVSVKWNAITTPDGNLALSMSTNTSIFSGTAATDQFFAWKNATPAIVGTSQGSPILSLCGRAFHGSADVEDCLTLKELPGNGNDAAIAYTLGHTGTSTGVISLIPPASGSSLGSAALRWSALFTAINASGSYTGFSAVTLATSTRCAASGTAANPSVVACSAAATGAFYCDVAASAGTCQVNNTSVTANSQIFVQPNTSEGTVLSKTCNTSLTIDATKPLLLSKSAGANFIINMPTVVTNGVCFDYIIWN